VQTKAELGAQMTLLCNPEQEHFVPTSTNIRRLAIQPARRVGGNNNNNNHDNNNDDIGGGDQGVDQMATSTPTPRSLYMLWQEYEFGVGGRKAAKEFSAAERGRVKYMYYSKRKNVCDDISRLIWQGWLANAAIDRICDVYGRGT